jgi:hypothetical protein
MAQQSAAMTAARSGAQGATPASAAPPSHWQGLRQRFDTLALRPPAVSTGLAPNLPPGQSPGLPPKRSAHDAAMSRRDADTRAALLAWCGQSAGPGGAPFWQPGARPRVDLRLAVGTLQAAAHATTRDGPAGPDAGHHPPVAAACAWVDHIACQLDGSLHLQALPGRAAGLAFRLGVKLHDAMWWRHRSAGDPWDAGWALTTTTALQHLHTAFWPRRATLVLADAQSPAPLVAALAALQQRQADFRHPVRWLWVGAEADLQALPALPASPGPPIRHFALA